MTSVLPLRVNILDSTGSFGVMYRHAVVKGNRIVLLVNVSNGPVTVHISDETGKSFDGYDLLNREVVRGTDCALPFQGVRLIRLDL